MSTIQAIVNVAQGQAEIRQLPYPELYGDEYILVKTTAWALNPDDAYSLGLPGNERVGTVVGGDFAGHVVAVGKHVVKPLKKGDRVAGVVRNQNVIRKQEGAFAEVIAVKGDIVMKVPDDVSDAEAATQGVAVATIAQVFYRELQLPAPEAEGVTPYFVVIYGGSTAMGITGIQFARLSGATVITTASAENRDYLLHEVGADHVLDYNSANLADQVRELAGGRVSFFFDARPCLESSKLALDVLTDDGTAKYVSLNPGTEARVGSANPKIRASHVLAYSASGDPYWFQNQYFEGSSADLELQKSFVTVAERLLAEGKVKAPRIFLNRGGEGFPGILHGLEEVRAKNVRGGKLVYTVGASG